MPVFYELLPWKPEDLSTDDRYPGRRKFWRAQLRLSSALENQLDAVLPIGAIPPIRMWAQNKEPVCDFPMILQGWLVVSPKVRDVLETMCRGQVEFLQVDVTYASRPVAGAEGFSLVHPLIRIEGAVTNAREIDPSKVPSHVHFLAGPEYSQLHVIRASLRDALISAGVAYFGAVKLKERRA
jgi:hypothetical protein